MKTPPHQTPFHQIEQVYAFARECYNKRFSGVEKDAFFDRIRLNRTSGIDFVRWYKHYLHGTKMARPMSVEATKYYFDKIYEEFGTEILKNAIKAARIHIEYYELHKGVYLEFKRDLCDEYEKLLRK